MIPNRSRAPRSRARQLVAVVALALAGLGLGGCIVYPDGPGYYGHGHYRGYYGY